VRRTSNIRHPVGWIAQNPDIDAVSSQRRRIALAGEKVVKPIAK
jgi:hypothetical protein